MGAVSEIAWVVAQLSVVTEIVVQLQTECRKYVVSKVKTIVGDVAVRVIFMQLILEYEFYLRL